MSRLAARPARLAALLASTLAAGSLAAPASAGEITIGSTVWIGYGPLFLAKELGYYSDLGLDLTMQMFDGGGEAQVALAAGQIDGLTTTVDGTMEYWRPDNCFKIVLGLDDSYGGDGILVTPDITALEELKGKQVAMDDAGVSGFWMQYLLRAKGMDFKDIELVRMSADEASAAFIAGRVPAAVTWEPNLTFATANSDGKILVDSAATPGVIVDVIQLSCSFIDEHPEDVKALVTGWYKALDYIKAEPEKSIEIMAKSIGGWLSDPKEVESTMKNVRFYGEEENKAYFGTADAPGPILETFELGNTVAIEMGRQAEPKDPKDVILWDYVTGSL